MPSARSSGRGAAPDPPAPAPRKGGRGAATVMSRSVTTDGASHSQSRGGSSNIQSKRGSYAAGSRCGMSASMSGSLGTRPVPTDSSGAAGRPRSSANTLPTSEKFKGPTPTARHGSTRPETARRTGVPSSRPSSGNNRKFANDKPGEDKEEKPRCPKFPHPDRSLPPEARARTASAKSKGAEKLSSTAATRIVDKAQEQSSVVARQMKKPPSKAFLEAHSKAAETAIFHKDEGTDQLHPKFLQQARRNGQMNLSGRGLVKVPERVWTINDLDEQEKKNVSKGLSLDRVEDTESWWDFVELNKLILASNKLSSLPPSVGNLLALTVLDLHDNVLESLPEEIAKLENLNRLNLNHNRLSVLPNDFFNLRQLRKLDLSNNQLSELSDEVGRLDFMEAMDLSYNQLKSLPPSIGYLTKMTIFNAGHNKLINVPDEISFLRDLSSLDLTSNELKTLPESMADLSKLERLHLRHNCLSSMPCLRNCNHLKEVHLGNNRLQEVTVQDVENMPNVCVLDLRDNKIAAIPDDIVNLQALERLDLTNNDLSLLPFSLGTLPNLKSLLVEGNPFKSIRRDIIQRGTVGLMKYLRSRLTESELRALSSTSREGTPPPIPGSGSPLPDAHSMRTTQALNLSAKGLTSVPDKLFEDAAESGVTSADLSKNNLNATPDGLRILAPSLFEVNLSANRLESVASWLGSMCAAKLQYLNLANNKLVSLPGDISQLSQLREVSLAYNRFEEVPSCLYSCPKLETIVLCGNKVVRIDVEGLSKLEMLAVLDLQNNSIDHVPPELGNLKQLRSLQLEGNAFRMPRPQVLVKGTEAVLAYLRDRIPK